MQIKHEKCSVEKVFAFKHLGQHFLHSPTILTCITETIKEIQTRTGATAITEIGPGLGALTNYLRPLVPQYCVMEKDRRFEAKLRKYTPELNILWGDALQQNWMLCPKGILVGNLPYNISVPLIFQWLSHSTHFSEAVFMVQKEVGKRIMGSPLSKAYGRLSVMVQSIATVRQVVNVAPGCFTPPPKVDSCVLHFTRKHTVPAFIRSLESLVKVSFSQRRKILKNTLKHYSTNIILETWESWLECIGASLNNRPEELTVDQYIHLSTILGEHRNVESH